MQKSILIALFVLLVWDSMSAQSYIAPKVGINGVAQYVQDEGLNFRTNQGYQIGAEIGTKWQNIIGLRAELFYANKAFSQTRLRIRENGSQTNLFSEIIDINNGSFEINGAVLITLGDGFELAIGPQFNFVTSSTGSGIWDFGSDSSSVHYDYLNDQAGEGGYWAYQEKDGNYFNRSQLAINVGIGLRLIHNLYIDLRTNYALNDLINDFYQDESFSTTKRFDFIVNMSYRIPLKKKRETQNKDQIP